MRSRAPISSLRLSSAPLLGCTALAVLAIGNPAVLAQAPPTPAQKSIEAARPSSALERAEALRRGVPVSDTNPLRVPDLVEARRVLSEAMQQPGSDRGDIATLLAEMMIAGEGGPSNLDEARRLLDFGVSLGRGGAALNRARLMQSEGKPTEFSAVERDLRLAMRLGAIAAYFDLADLQGAASDAGRETAAAGIKLLERDIALGRSNALVALADILAGGLYTAADLQRARALYETAFEKGQPAAALRLAKLHAAPKSPLFDPEAAKAWLQRAAEGGSLEAARQLAVAGMFGGPMGVTPAVGRDWLMRALEAGDPAARLYEGIAQRIASAQAGTDQQFADILADPRLALSDLLKVGDIVSRAGGENAGRLAITVYAAAVVRGGLNADYRFAAAVFDQPGIATEQERQAATTSLQRAAAAGHVPAALLLARRYRTGSGAEQSWEKAREVLQRAIAIRGGHGSRALDLSLAETLLLGDPASVADGVKLYEKTAAAGDTDAMLELSRIYQSGDHVPRDTLAAEYWLDQAARRGNRDAIADLAELLSQSRESADLNRAVDLQWQLARGGDHRAYGALLRYGGFLENPKVHEDIVSAARRKDHAAALALAQQGLADSRGEPLAPEISGWLEAAASGGGLAERIAAASVMVTSGRPELASRAEELLVAAGNDNLEAQTLLGLLYLSGRAGEDKVAAGRRKLEEASRRGWEPARIELASALLAGARPDDLPKAIALLAPVTRADSAQHAKAMFLLGRAYEANGPQEIGRALELYRSAAADGFIPAMARLAHIYAEGARDVAADQILALRWMKRAAAGTDADAVMQYARFLASSPAAGVRPEDAFVQYLRAARLGSAEAMLQLGRAYLSGTGVSRDDAEGLKWLARAAEAQNSDAMLELYSHAEMNGGAETEEAGKWLARSAALGNLSAMYRLGVSPFVGPAAAISSENALEWLRQAERRGHRPSKRAIAVIIANQTEEEEEVEDE